MKIAILALAIAFFGLTIAVWALYRKVDGMLDKAADAALGEAEFRRGTKKEMSKIYSYADENAGEIKKLTRSLNALSDGTKALDRKIKELDTELADIKKSQDALDWIAQESVKAQIDSEKAWADGVRALTGYGTAIPALNTKVLDNG